MDASGIQNATVTLHNDTHFIMYSDFYNTTVCAIYEEPLYMYIDLLFLRNL